MIPKSGNRFSEKIIAIAKSRCGGAGKAAPGLENGTYECHLCY